MARITKAIFTFDDLDFAFRPGVADIVVLDLLFVATVVIIFEFVVVIDVVVDDLGFFFFSWFCYRFFFFGFVWFCF